MVFSSSVQEDETIQSGIQTIEVTLQFQAGEVYHNQSKLDPPPKFQQIRTILIHKEIKDVDSIGACNSKRLGGASSKGKGTGGGVRLQHTLIPGQVAPIEEIILMI